MSVPLAERAPAKVNLTLSVRGRLDDGYHELESLVVFADVADRLSLTPADALDLRVAGRGAEDCGAPADNLVLKAARALASDQILRSGRFRLAKQLPVAAGLGGGSSDAAAALRLLARLNGVAEDDPRLMAAARATGADVPVCLDPRPRMMRGIGERLSGLLDLPPLPAILVNPGVAVPTRDVFAALQLTPGEMRAASSDDDIPRSRAALLDYLHRHGNDLEPPATVLQPVIADVLRAINAAPRCRLARMSGSGATCFGLFASRAGARDAARALRAEKPDWWIRAVTLGSA
jgi:4-diphosphocytidyl-2-C-methyl-D-erythritol kinase